MTSSASGRYNNEANTNISLSAVGDATGLAKNVGAYRNRVGIQTNDVKFSDLKGVYAGGTGDSTGYITLDDTNYSSYLTHFVGLSDKNTLTQYQGAWFLLGNSYYSNDPLPLVYQKNVTTGGFNWGVRYQLSPTQMILPRGNLLIKSIMWKNYTLAFGKFDGTERAICYGPIEMKSVNSTYTTSYADLSNVFTLNGLIGQNYFGDYSHYGPDAYTSFRTTTRTTMIGLWKKTDGLLYHAWLDTAPFISGASLSGSYVASIEQGLNDYGWRANGHKNNQITFGTAFQYAGYDECTNPAGRSGGGVGYYTFLVYDIGLRNATSGSVLNSGRGHEGDDSSADVPGFSQ